MHNRSNDKWLGYEAVIAFYNQTYHSITLACGLRQIKKRFKLSRKMVDGMCKTAQTVIKSVVGNGGDKDLSSRWRDAVIALRRILARESEGGAERDDFDVVYGMNELAHSTWVRLCDNREASHCAQERLTNIHHPSLHPALGEAKSLVVESASNTELQEAIKRKIIENSSKFVRSGWGKPNGQG